MLKKIFSQVLLGVMCLSLAGSVFAAPTPPIAPVPPNPDIPRVTTPVAPITSVENESVTASELPLESTATTSSDQNQGEVESGNQATGPGSTNNQTTDITSEKDIEIENNGSVENNIGGVANTGNNQASNNTNGGNITTGDIEAGINIMNIINSSFISENGEIMLIVKDINGDAVGDYVFDPESGNAYSLTGVLLGPSGNSETGPESENTATNTQNNSATISTDNKANVGNNIVLSTNTGNNTANGNTNGGDIMTGGVDIAINLFNFINSTFVAVDGGLIGLLNVFGDWDGNLVLPQSFLEKLSGKNNVAATNSSTGPDSENQANTVITNILDIDNDNVADVETTINIDAVTGENSSSGNTTAGNIETGDTMVDVNLANELNKNVIGDFVYVAFVNVLGKWNGSDLISPLLNTISNVTNPFLAVINELTGPESNNQISVESNNTTVIANENFAKLNNFLNIFANTGNNTTSNNTRAGDISTGDVNVMANILNFANLNVISDRFVFLVINVFGDWNGSITTEGKKVSAIDANPEVAVSGGLVGGILTTLPKNSAFKRYYANSITNADEDRESNISGGEVLSVSKVELLPDVVVANEAKSKDEIIRRGQALNYWFITLGIIGLISVGLYIKQKS